MKRKTIGVSFIVLVLIILQTSFTTAQVADEKESLLKRAEMFWRAEVEGDWADLYGFLPNHVREKLTFDDFLTAQEKNPMRIRSFKLSAVEIDGATGWIEVDRETELTTLPGFKPKNVRSWQVWQKQAGEWHPVPSDLLEAFPKRPPGQRPSEEEALLVGRANEFWTAKETDDVKKVYLYLEPRYKNRVPEEKFLSKNSLINYLSHKIDWAEVTDETGKVKVTFSYGFKDPSMAKIDPVYRAVIEDWVKVDGIWYRAIKEKKERSM